MKGELCLLPSVENMIRYVQLVVICVLHVLLTLLNATQGSSAHDGRWRSHRRPVLGQGWRWEPAAICPAPSNDRSLGRPLGSGGAIRLTSERLTNHGEFREEIRGRCMMALVVVLGIGLVCISITFAVFLVLSWFAPAELWQILFCGC